MYCQSCYNLGMTTYDYYSIPLRIGILMVVLSCSAIANMILHLSDVMDINAFKCIIAMWALVGVFGIDITKNGIRQRRRNWGRAERQG